MSEAPPRRVRPAARVVLIDGEERVLLFRFTPDDYPPFWVLPGGECDSGEDFPQAARRELFEETGIEADPSPLQLIRQAEYEYLGEPVKSVEHFFHHRTRITRIDTSRHTELERTIMQDHRWFTRAEVADWRETIYPLDLIELIELALRGDPFLIEPDRLQNIFCLPGFPSRQMIPSGSKSL